MKYTISIFIWCLSFMLNFLCLSSGRRRFLSGLSVFVLTFLYVNIAVKYELGRGLAGLICSCILLVLVIVFAQVIVDKKIDKSHWTIAIAILMICSICEVLINMVRRVVNMHDRPYISWILFPILTFLLSYISNAAFDKLRKQPKNETIFFVFGIAGIITALLFFLVFGWVMNINEIQNTFLLIISIINFLLLIGIFLLSLLYYSKYIKLSYEREIIEKETANIILSAKMVESVYNKLKSFRHDYKNIILSLSLKEDSESMMMLREWEKEFFAVDSQYENVLMQLMKIHNLPVRSLISSKAIHFINENIAVDINVIGEIRDFYMEDFDLIRILGVFLDNAFEEAQCTNDKRIYIGVLGDNETFTVVIENSCRETTPYPDRFIEKGFSTKGEKRGTGLSNVSEIIGRYKRCSYQLGKREGEPNIFYAELILQAD